MNGLAKPLISSKLSPKIVMVLHSPAALAELIVAFLHHAVHEAMTGTKA
jgi:hypothetical protein